MIHPTFHRTLFAVALATSSLMASTAQAAFSLVDSAQPAVAPYPMYSAPAQSPDVAVLQAELMRLRSELKTSQALLQQSQAELKRAQEDLLACRAEREPTQITKRRTTINFPFGHSSLNPTTADAEYLISSAKSALRIVITGHTDSLGSLAANRRVAQQRAEAARLFLVRRGISADKITVDGRAGEFIAPNDTEAGRAANRRVDFDFFR